MESHKRKRSQMFSSSIRMSSPDKHPKRFRRTEEDEVYLAFAQQLEEHILMSKKSKIRRLFHDGSFLSGNESKPKIPEGIEFEKYNDNCVSICNLRLNLKEFEAYENMLDYSRTRMSSPDKYLQHSYYTKEDEEYTAFAQGIKKPLLSNTKSKIRWLFYDADFISGNNSKTKKPERIEVKNVEDFVFKKPHPKSCKK